MGFYLYDQIKNPQERYKLYFYYTDTKHAMENIVNEDLFFSYISQRFHRVWANSLTKSENMFHRKMITVEAN